MIRINSIKNSISLNFDPKIMILVLKCSEEQIYSFIKIIII